MPTIQSLIGTYLEAIRSVIGGVLTAIQGLENSVDEFPRTCKVSVAENTLDRVADVGNHAHDVVKDGNPRRAEYFFTRAR